MTPIASVHEAGLENKVVMRVEPGELCKVS